MREKEKPSEAAPAPVNAVSNPSVNQFPIDLSSVDPKKIQMANELGIPISQIFAWISSVEARFTEIEKTLPLTVQNAMTQAIEEAKKNQIQQMPPQQTTTPPALNPGAIGSFLQALPALMQGSGQDDLLNKLSANALQAQINMSNAITNAVVSKLMAKATSEVAESVSG